MNAQTSLFVSHLLRLHTHTHSLSLPPPHGALTHSLGVFLDSVFSLTISLSFSPHPLCFHGNLPVDGAGEEGVRDGTGQEGPFDGARAMSSAVLRENRLLSIGARRARSFRGPVSASFLIHRCALFLI